MAVINCPKCQGKLKFPDDSPPRRVKCPACGTGFVAGPQGPADDAEAKSSAKLPPAAPKKAEEEVTEDFDVVDDDKPARSKSRDDDRDHKKRRDDEDDRDRKRGRDDDEEDRDRDRKRRPDEDEDDRDRDRDRKRRRDDDEDDRDRDRDRKRRRDEDDEDDRDRDRKRRRDEDDDSPFSRRDRRDDDDDDDRGSRSRRRDRDDDYDDYDDDDRGRSKKKSKKEEARAVRSQWECARRGINFVNYGFYCQLGSFGGLILAYLIGWIGSREPIITILACIPGLVGFILAGVGIGFIVAGPRRGNLLGLSIALAATAGVHLLIMLIAAFGDKKPYGYAWGGSSANWLILPTSFLEFIVMIMSKSGDALIICVGLFEIARYILLTLYLKELAKICKERDAAGTCTMLMIALPSTVVGSILIALLGWEIMKEAQPSLTFLQIFGLLFILIKLGAYTFIYLFTIKTSNEISDSAYKMY